MVKFRIYIDTSVIGGCFDDEFAEYSTLLFQEFIRIRGFNSVNLKEGYQVIEIRSPMEIIDES
ncbi:MAG: hypothetical protein Q6358_09950 [Candidatus Brocadiales bacterium]|nr:hypothetical protein [Candidatus Brocadiales bacterium]